MKIFMSVILLAVLAVIMIAAFRPASVLAQRRRMPQMLDDDDLNVGDPLPALTVLSDTGEPFPLVSLKGSYAVLVFGCLT